MTTLNDHPGGGWPAPSPHQTGDDGADDTAATIANLERALHTSRLIGTAIGILMERHRLSADDAFKRLVQTSQRTNRKVNDLARHLADTGEEL